MKAAHSIRTIEMTTAARVSANNSYTTACTTRNPIDNAVDIALVRERADGTLHLRDLLLIQIASSETKDAISSTKVVVAVVSTLRTQPSNR
jgi:hypothetical protein